MVLALKIHAFYLYGKRSSEISSTALKLSLIRLSLVEKVQDSAFCFIIQHILFESAIFCLLHAVMPSYRRLCMYMCMYVFVSHFEPEVMCLSRCSVLVGDRYLFIYLFIYLRQKSRFTVCLSSWQQNYQNGDIKITLMDNYLTNQYGFSTTPNIAVLQTPSLGVWKPEKIMKQLISNMQMINCAVKCFQSATSGSKVVHKCVWEWNWDKILKFTHINIY